MQNDGVAHETPVNGALLPSGSGIDQLSPSHWESPPDADMQNIEETQEMADTDPQSPLVRFHKVPLKANAFPSASTAAQYDDDAHPTASRPLAPPKVTGADQLCPLKVMT